MSDIPDQLRTAVDRFVTVIDSYSGLQVVEMTVALEEVSFLCRASELPRWHTVVNKFLLSAPEDWKVHIGQRLIRAERNGHPAVVNPWYIGLKSEDLVSLLEQAGGLLVKSSLRREAAPQPGAVSFTATKPKQAPAKSAPVPAKAKPLAEEGKGAFPTHAATVTKMDVKLVDESGPFKRTFQPVTGAS